MDDYEFKVALCREDNESLLYISKDDLAVAIATPCSEVRKDIMRKAVFSDVDNKKVGFPKSFIINLYNHPDIAKAQKQMLWRLFPTVESKRDEITRLIVKYLDRCTPTNPGHIPYTVGIRPLPDTNRWEWVSTNTPSTQVVGLCALLTAVAKMDATIATPIPGSRGNWWAIKVNDEPKFMEHLTKEIESLQHHQPDFRKWVRFNRTTGLEH